MHRMKALGWLPRVCLFLLDLLYWSLCACVWMWQFEIQQHLSTWIWTERDSRLFVEWLFDMLVQKCGPEIMYHTWRLKASSTERDFAHVSMLSRTHKTGLSLKTTRLFSLPGRERILHLSTHAGSNAAMAVLFLVTTAVVAFNTLWPFLTTLHCCCKSLSCPVSTSVLWWRETCEHAYLHFLEHVI